MRFAKMPAGYSHYLRWRVIWLKEIVGIEVEVVNFYTQMSITTINCYIQKFINWENVSTVIIGKPYYCISMLTHEELVIVALLLRSILIKRWQKCCTKYIWRNKYMKKLVRNMRAPLFITIWEKIALVGRRLVSRVTGFTMIFCKNKN